MPTALLPLALAGLLAVQPPPDEGDNPGGKFEPPVVGRPDGFTGAVGTFRVAARAAPTTVEVEKPVRLTLRVTAVGNPVAPPGRPRLDAGAFTRPFFVADADPPQKKADERTWEFYYLLKPKSTAVVEVPQVAFHFFDPSFGDDPRGYQRRFTDAIPLKVTPPRPARVTVAGAPDPPPVPDAVLEVVRGDEVLRSDGPWSPPPPGMLALLLLAPPAACAAWYAVWRRFHPDEARRAQRRRSRAARQALQAVRGAGGGEPDQHAGQLADAVTLYLRQRLDLPQAVPTPREASEHLAKAGLSEDLCRQAAAFFDACDTLRFAPHSGGGGEHLADAASDLILAVEEEAWSPHQQP